MLLIFAVDHPMEETHYGSSTAVSETSGSYMVASDFTTPAETTSLTLVQPEQVVMSEPATYPTQEPNNASTSHQEPATYPTQEPNDASTPHQEPATYPTQEPNDASTPHQW